MTARYKLPRGLRNNNPGNIRASAAYRWDGQTGADRDGFAIFSTPGWGLRALLIVWRNYHLLHGLTTLRACVERWAPPSENDTDGYVRRLASLLSVDPDEPWLSDAMPIRLMRAVTTIECGVCPWTTALLTGAVALAVPPRLTSPNE